jgi:hypothetical protein
MTMQSEFVTLECRPASEIFNGEESIAIDVLNLVGNEVAKLPALKISLRDSNQNMEKYAQMLNLLPCAIYKVHVRSGIKRFGQAL